MRTTAVFIVHEWETIDNFHHVHVWKNSEHPKTTQFPKDKWKKALAFTEKETRRLGLKEYQVDSPRRPHKFVSIK